MNFIDLMLVLLVGFTIFQGYHNGFIIFSFAVFGLALSIAISFLGYPWLKAQSLASGFLLVGFSGIVFLGLIAGFIMGRLLKGVINSRKILKIDAFLGALTQTIAFLVVIMIVVAPLVNYGATSTQESLQKSRLVQAITRFTPKWINRLPEKFEANLPELNFPNLGESFNFFNLGTPPPDVSKIPTGALRAAVTSVVKIVADANLCNREQVGTGFVVAKDYILTNAHVVAGSNQIRVWYPRGNKLAELVYFDAANDIAVLHVDKLSLPKLEFIDRNTYPNEFAMILGFPGGTKFQANQVTILSQVFLRGQDIYSTGLVVRKVYTFSGKIEHGNSGGPLLARNGKVLGLVFGVEQDNPQVGFAMTAAQVLPYLTPIITNSPHPVSSGVCVFR